MPYIHNIYITVWLLLATPSPPRLRDNPTKFERVGAK